MSRDLLCKKPQSILSKVIAELLIEIESIRPYASKDWLRSFNYTNLTIRLWEMQPFRTLGDRLNGKTTNTLLIFELIIFIWIPHQRNDIWRSTNREGTTRENWYSSRCSQDFQEQKNLPASSSPSSPTSPVKRSWSPLIQEKGTRSIILTMPNALLSTLWPVGDIYLLPHNP